MPFQSSAAKTTAERDDVTPYVSKKRTSAAKAVVRRPFTARLNPCPSCRYAFPSACLALRPGGVLRAECAVARAQANSRILPEFTCPERLLGGKKPRG